jgi:hypothetical protein
MTIIKESIASLFYILGKPARFYALKPKRFGPDHLKGNGLKF